MVRNRNIRRKEAKIKWRKSKNRRKISFTEFWRKKYIK